MGQVGALRPDLPSEVEHALTRLGGEATAREIAQALGASAADVAGVLRGSGRFSGPWVRGRAPRVRKVYKLAAAPQGARGARVRPGTQTGRVLDVLSDGEWHSTRSILRAVPCIVHSRIADLRAKGYRVEHRGHGGGADRNEYRLLPGTLGEAPGGHSPGVSSSAAGPPLAAASARDGGDPTPPTALTLFDEAAA